MRFVRQGILLMLFGLAAMASRANEARNLDTLSLLPAQTTLFGAQATQRLLVEATRGGRYNGDLSAKAVFASSNPKVARVGTDGIAQAVGDGIATVTATIGGKKAAATVRVTGTGRPFAWNFRNHILPVLTKASCNSGACHGAAAGKGGLKLTLRGYDPDADYTVLTRQALGRRLVPGVPDQSLLLLKPTMKIGHGGGKRIDPRSRDYTVLASWVRSGVPRPRPDDPRLDRLEVFPALASLHPGDTQQILVRALYSDGRSEDVTNWVKFGTSDNSVATVDDFGKVTMNGYGEAAITVWFSSRVTFARVVAPYPNAPAPETFARAERVNLVDDLVLKKLQSLGIPPSSPCTDGEFLRRAMLDAAGVLPTPQETRAFLQDTAPDKRAKLIDRLLERPEFVDYWTYKWSDLLLVSSRRLNSTAVNAFSGYIRQSVAENKPWNTFARDILTAQGSNFENGAVNYFVLHKEPIDLTETTTQAFLGMSLTCARCHNHPLEKWTLQDYYQMANLFARVRLKNGEQGGEVLVLASDKGDIAHPRLGVPLPPRPLDGKEIPLTDSRDRRALLAEWLTAPENPYFSKSLVNRVWRNFMGRGLVEAEDDLRLTNPPSNQELLDALAADFARKGYDVKRLIRLIMNSAAYQRSAAAVGVNAKDDRYYSRYLVRRLPAEVLLDAVAQVTAVPTEFPGYAKGTRALQLRDSQVASPFLATFGRPEREKTCACERTQDTNVAQALHLANGDTLNTKLRAGGGLIDRLLAENADDARVLNELYLTALCREPTEKERATALPILAETTPYLKEPRRAVLEDLFWAVLTDKEFLFNH